MIYLGTVNRNDDPKEIGRVRVTVPGRFDTTDWLLSADTMGDGEGDSAGVVVPRIGAVCLVLLANGDASKGYYIVPNRSGYGIEGESIFIMGDIEIALAEDNAVIVKNVVDGITVNKIEFQTQTGCMIIKSSAILNIQATAVKIDAQDVEIMGRKVLPTGGDI